MHDQTVALHAKLDELAIPHVFDDYGPGHHAWPDWARDLEQTLPDLMATLDHPPAVPAAVTYTSAAPEYDVYGWHVEVERPALELSRLSGAGRRGFTLAGSGTGEVTTPPGHRHAEVEVGDAAPEVHTGPRLTIRVPLGEGNPDQQYRPGATTAVTETQVAITPCLARRAARLHLPAGLVRARARVNGSRRRVRGRRLRVRLTPGTTTRVVVRARGFKRVRRFRACTSAA